MRAMKIRVFSAFISGLAMIIVIGCGEGGGNPGLNQPGGGTDTSGVSLFSDGFENGLDNWVTDLWWGLSTSAHTGLYALYVWDETNDTGVADLDVDFDLTEYESATLRFWTKSNYGNMNPGNADRRVLVEANDETIQTLWVENFQFNEPWTEVTISLDFFCGWAEKFEIAFWYTKYQPGVIIWWLDDVEVKAN